MLSDKKAPVTCSWSMQAVYSESVQRRAQKEHADIDAAMQQLQDALHQANMARRAAEEQAQATHDAAKLCTATLQQAELKEARLVEQNVKLQADLDLVQSQLHKAQNKPLEVLIVPSKSSCCGSTYSVSSVSTIQLSISGPSTTSTAGTSDPNKLRDVDVTVNLKIEGPLSKHSYSVGTPRSTDDSAKLIREAIENEVRWHKRALHSTHS
jgi:hypothetical protein